MKRKSYSHYFGIDRGVGLIEQALLIVLIAMVAIGAVSEIGLATRDTFKANNQAFERFVTGCAGIEVGGACID